MSELDTAYEIERREAIAARNQVPEYMRNPGLARICPSCGRATLQADPDNNRYICTSPVCTYTSDLAVR